MKLVSKRVKMLLVILDMKNMIGITKYYFKNKYKKRVPNWICRA